MTRINTAWIPILLTFWGCRRTDPTVAPASSSKASPADAGDNSNVVSVISPAVAASIFHDRASFTQGFAFWHGRLFEGTGLYGQSIVHELDPKSGRELRRVTLDEKYFGEGITVLGDRLYQLTWQEHRCFVYDVRSLKRLLELSYEGEGWGLANDGRLLIMSDGSEWIRFRDPSTLAVVRSLRVTYDGSPLPYLNELEMVRGELWANVWQTNSIVRISLETGRVTSRLDLTAILSQSLPSRNAEDVLNGIAFDDQTGRLLITGKRWPLMFEIRAK